MEPKNDQIDRKHSRIPKALVVLAGGIAMAMLVMLAGSASGGMAYEAWQSPNLNDDDYDEILGLAVADQNDDGILDIWAGADNATVIVFSGEDHQVLARYNFTSALYDVNTLLLADLDDDDADELIVGMGSGAWNGAVGIIDPATGDQLYLNTSVGNVMALAAADTDGDSETELIVGGSSFDDRVFVFDGTTHAREWNTTELEGDIPTLLVADTDGDTTVEVWAGIIAYGDEIGEYEGQLQVFDGSDGSLLWNRTDLDEPVRHIELVGDEVWFTTGELGDSIGEMNGRIHRLKTLDHSEIEESGNLDERGHCLKLAQMVEGDEAEILLATFDSIHILDDGYTELWEAHYLGEIGAHNSLWVGDLDDDDVLDIVFHSTKLASITTLNEASYVWHYIVKDDPPTAVTLELREKGKQYMFVDWNMSEESDFDRYEVHVSTTASFTPSAATLVVEIDDVWDESYRIENLTAGTTYHVILQVCDEGGQCTDSNELTVRTEGGDGGDDDDPGFTAVSLLVAMVVVGWMTRKRSEVG